MPDKDKTKEELLEEVIKSRRRILALEKDCDDYKRAKDDLSKSEEKYRRLVDSLQEGIWVLDKEENTTFVNNRMAEMLGYTVEEMLGKKVFDFMDERGIKLCKEKVAARKAGVKEQHDFELIKKDGSILHVLMEASPIKDDDGNYIGGMAAVIDITERTRAEEMLRDKNTMFQTLINAIPDQVFFKDSIGRYLLVNKAMEETLGIRQEAFVGKTDDDISSPDVAEKCKKSDAEAIQRGGPVCSDESYTDKKGETRFLDVVKAPIYDSKGDVAGLVVVSRDITERKKTAEKLRESEERFRLAMLGASDGLWDWDLQTDEVYYSPRWKSMLGYAEEELESHLDIWKRVVHPDDLEPSLLLINDFLEGRVEKYELEFRLRHKDGHYLNILSRATLVRGADRTALRLVGTHVDITERKKAEEELRKYRQYLEFLVKERTVELEKQKTALEQKNITLREIVGQIELEKNKIKENILGNIDELITPILKRARSKDTGEKHMELIEQNLKKITSSFGVTLSSKKLKLTPREIDICNMVEKGLTNKEMSDYLNISIQSIEGYRKNIRKKLGLSNKKVNLTTYLRNLQ